MLGRALTVGQCSSFLFLEAKLLKQPLSVVESHAVTGTRLLKYCHPIGIVVNGPLDAHLWYMPSLLSQSSGRALLCPI